MEGSPCKKFKCILGNNQYKGEENIWIITGTGHHKDGHQAEGVLFYMTVEYLNRNGYAFKIGVDSRGFRGALHLEKV